MFLKLGSARDHMTKRQKNIERLERRIRQQCAADSPLFALLDLRPQGNPQDLYWPLTEKPLTPEMKAWLRLKHHADIITENGREIIRLPGTVKLATVPKSESAEELKNLLPMSELPLLPEGQR